MARTVEQVLEAHPKAGRDALIPLLQEVQEVEGYLSRANMERIARHLNISSAKVYGVASFYNQFRFYKPGKYLVQLCRGTACHVKGSLPLLEALQRELKIEPGQTTRDGLFSIEVVACIGACGLAPVVAVNGEFHAAMTKARLPRLIDEYRKRAVQ
ncbi:MAG: NAD(P)H-dependent oxidoreductase subunit E [Elusimicrobiota bacterium]|jgi:NADH-quinone oxidoreductase subunit E